MQNGKVETNRFREFPAASQNDLEVRANAAPFSVRFAYSDVPSAATVKDMY